MRNRRSRICLYWVSGIAIAIVGCQDARNARTDSCLRSLESRLLETPHGGSFEAARPGDWTDLRTGRASELVEELISKHLVDCMPGEPSVAAIRNGTLRIWVRSSSADRPEIVIAERKPET